MLFLCVVLVVLQKMSCQQYMVDTEFKVESRRPDETFAHIYLDFICPEGFIPDENRCFLNTTISSCPDLESLNVQYQLRTSSNDRSQKPDVSNLKCSYSFEDFLKLHTEGNSIELQLFVDGSPKAYTLFLDVSMDKPIDNLTDKISCLSKIPRIQPEVVAVEECDDFSKENATTRRFSLKLTKELRMFYCYVLVPGRIKPSGSNVLVANSQTNGTFIVRLGEVVDYKIRKRLKYKMSSMVIDEKTDKYVIAIDNPDAYAVRSKLEEYMTMFFKVTEIVSTNFCLEEDSDTGNLTWPKTYIGQFAYPKDNFCLDEDGRFVRRRCEGDYLSGARWSSINISCSNRSLPLITKSLVRMQKENVTDEVLDELSKMIEVEDVQQVDVDLILNVLERATCLGSDLSEDSFFGLVGRVDQFVDSTRIKNHTKEKLITSIVQYVWNLKSNGSHNFIAYSSVQPFRNNFLKFKLDGIQIVLTGEFLDELHLTREEREGFGMNIVVFNSKNLFPKNEHLYDKVVDVKFEGTTKVKKAYKYPILIYFPRNKGEFVCAFWDAKTGKWSKLGIETYLREDSVECQSYHLTKFSLLIVSAEKLPQRTNSLELLDLAARIELTASAFCVFILLLLATTSSIWRKKRFYVIQLSLVILLESCLFLIVDFGENFFDEEYCKYIGVFLHLFVLEKFLVIFLIGVAQIGNFMKVFKKSKKIVATLSCHDTLLRWLVPFLVVLISVLCYPEKYTIERPYRFCYPREEPHTFFVLAPVTAVLSFNAVVFAVVMTRIVRSPSKQAQSTLFQFKLAVMLWFLLGGTWLAGVLVNVLPEGICQDICFYAFTLVAPLQGFVVFLFYVILDKSTRLTWKISFWSAS